MTNFKKGMLLGLTLGAATVTLIASLLVFNIYQTAKPGFMLGEKSKVLSNKERLKTVDALVKLSSIYSFIGNKKLAIVTLGSAGALIVNENPSEKLTRGSYYLLEAADLAEEYALKSQDYDPLLENYFHHALFLKYMGQIKPALNKLNAGIELATIYASKSHWVDNLKNAKKHVESLR